MLVASLNTPLSVTEKSASNSNRSIADLSTPVTPCTARGVANSNDRMSFLMARTFPPLSSTDSVVHPRPDSLAMRHSSPFLCRDLQPGVSDVLGEFFIRHEGDPEQCAPGLV